MPVLAPNIRDGQHGLANGVLDAQAELRASWRFVLVFIEAGDVVDGDRRLKRLACQHAGLGIREGNVGETDAGSKRHGSRIVVDVVALDAFVHDAVSTADNSLAV